MIFRIGVENGDANRSTAWVLDHPGCFAYGPSQPEALAAVPRAVQDYAGWIARRTPEPWVESGSFHVLVEDVWDVYGMNEQYDLRPLDEPEVYSINAWFRHDWKPLSEEDVRRGLALLAWSRADLLEVVRDCSQADLDYKPSGERWSVGGILSHVGGAEWWYLDRLGLAFPRSDLPANPFERLEMVRAHLNQTLPSLVSSTLVLGKDAEFWSPRKLLRRAVWHERDHTAHIAKLLQGKI